MSETAFEHDFLATPDVSTRLPQPLRARPQGVRAALGMGGAATVILLATMAFVKPRDASEHAAEEPRAALDAPIPVPAPQKIATKVETAAPVIPANVALPFSAFDLSAPDFAQEKKTIGVRDGDDGAGRVDTIMIGQFEAGASFVRVDVHQNATEKEADADFFLDMTRHATRLGLTVAKISAPGAMQTRFGAFEAADIRLTQPASEGVAASERSCLAARLVDPKASLVVASLACGSSTLPIDRGAFGCLLNQLEYKAGAKDESDAVGGFFQKAAGTAADSCRTADDVETTASIPSRPRPHAVHAGHSRHQRRHR